MTLTGSSSPQPASGGKGTMLLQDKRIFVVEDNLENRIVIDLLLKDHGATTGFERWGILTINRLKEFAPVDIILLDLMFPKGVTGYSIYDSIRACDEFKEVPIVAVSAADANEVIPRAKAKGFAGFIGKPLQFAEFPKQIAAILNGEPIWQD